MVALRGFGFLLLLIFLPTVCCEYSLWEHVDAFIYHWSYHEEGIEKEIVMEKAFHPDVNYIYDALKEVESLPLILGVQTEIFFIPAFSYVFFEITPPYLDQMGEDQTSNLIIYSTAHSGAHSMYGMISGPPSYFRHQYAVYAPSSGNSIRIPYDNTIDTVYLSLEGSKLAIWNQYGLSNDPAVVAASLVVTTFRVGVEYSPPLIELIDGRSMFLEATQSIFAYLSFDNTRGIQPSEMYAQSIEGESIIYISCERPYPSFESNDYVVNLGEENARALSKIICFTPMIYFTVTGFNETSKQLFMVNKAMEEIELLQDMEVVVSLTPEQEQYFYIHVPGTSAYKWMKIIYRSFGTTSIYVKCGKHPTKLEYDWRAIGRGATLQENSVTEELYIPATDPAFNAGIYYIWLYEEIEGRTQKHLEVSLSTWYPRLI